MPTDQINPLISTQTNALRAAPNVRMSTEHQLPNMSGIRGLERRPTHPGETLRANVLPALGLTQKEFANHLGVSRMTVSELLHEKRGVTPDMAIRLGKLLGNGPRIWLHMQQRVDIWVLEQRGGYESIEQLHVAY